MSVSPKILQKSPRINSLDASSKRYLLDNLKEPEQEQRRVPISSPIQTHAVKATTGPKHPTPAEMRSKYKIDVFEVKDNYSPEFRLYYERGDLPVIVEHTAYCNKLAWKTPIQKLEYHQFLPLFVDGIRDTKFPYCFIAEKASFDMISAGGAQCVPVIPQLIIPIKKALETKNEVIIIRVLKLLKLLLQASPASGPALVPYFRQILPTFNLYINRNVNIGDRMYYGQRYNNNIGDEMLEVLEMFERSAGIEALINIRYIVPTYQSCMN